MKTTVIFLVLLVAGRLATGQTDPDSSYNARLFYTCKVWGFVKYFHPKVADGTVEYDAVLLNALPLVREAASPIDFNRVLNELIHQPGEVPEPTITMPEVPENLKMNLDLSWFNDPLISSEVRLGLEMIFERFRPRPHRLVVDQSMTGIAGFWTELDMSTRNLEQENQRLLALFRYWNMIRYFYPYSNLMDQDWDTTLREFIPRMSKWVSNEYYCLTFKELGTRLNTAHAFTTGMLIDEVLGTKFPGFSVKRIDDKTVVHKVAPEITDIKPGDIIRRIDGHDMTYWRDSLMRYVHAGNQHCANWALDNNFILRGQEGEFEIELENENGSRVIKTDRNRDVQFFASETAYHPVWRDTVINGNTSVSIVDMRYLLPDSIPPMGTKFWESDCIIFDMRNYPASGVIYLLPNLFYPNPLHICKIIYPDLTFPGIIQVRDYYAGEGSPNHYQGRIILLIDEVSISASEFAIMFLQQHPGCVKIGRQTRGADGNVANVPLLGRMTTLFEVIGIMGPDSSQVQRTGILPDIPVPLTISGIRAGKDEDIEAAFQNISLSSDLDMDRHADQFAVYPNPASGSFMVEYKDWRHGQKLRILDLSGKLVWEGMITQERTHINTENLLPGIYLIKILADKCQLTGKIVKL